MDGEYKYAIYQPKTLQGKEAIGFDHYQPGEVTEQHTIHYVPMRRCPWDLSGPPMEYTDDLWNDVMSFIYNHIDLLDQRQYDILTAWVFASWISEAWSVVPYLFFYGPKNSGKSKALEVLKALSYRGLMSANISEAAVFRVTQSFHPTLILDETEIYTSEAKASIQNLLNAGYRRGQYAIRVSGIDQGNPKIDMFEVFGFKALAGTRGFKDTLESRSIIIIMEKNIRSIRFSIDQEKARELRSKLLMWRWRKLTEVSEVSEVFHKDMPRVLSFSDGRFVELYASLMTIAKLESPTAFKELLSYAKDQYNVDQEEETMSIDAVILQKILENAPNLENGKFSTHSIAESFNKDRSDKEKWGTTSVGRVIKRMGFTPKRMSDSRYGYLYDATRIQRLCKRYGIPSTGASETSETSVDGYFKGKAEEEEPQKGVKQYTVEYDPEKKPSNDEPESGVSLDLKRLINAIEKLEKEDTDTNRENIRNLLKGFAWKREYFDRIMLVALKDGSIYEPRPGIYRVTK